MKILVGVTLFWSLKFRNDFFNPLKEIEWELLLLLFSVDLKIERGIQIILLILSSLFIR